MPPLRRPPLTPHFILVLHTGTLLFFHAIACPTNPCNRGHAVGYNAAGAAAGGTKLFCACRHVNWCTISGWQSNGGHCAPYKHTINTSAAWLQDR